MDMYGPALGSVHVLLLLGSWHDRVVRRLYLLFVMTDAPVTARRTRSMRIADGSVSKSLLLSMSQQASARGGSAGCVQRLEVVRRRSAVGAEGTGGAM